MIFMIRYYRSNNPATSCS